jgi:hypothetical protein
VAILLLWIIGGGLAFLGVATLVGWFLSRVTVESPAPPGEE